MGDAGGAGRDGDDTRDVGSRCGGCGSGGLGRLGLRLLLGVDDVEDERDDFFLRTCGSKSRKEVLLHERAGELGEDLEVCLAAAGGGCDEEDEVRVAVRARKIDALRQAREREGRLGDNLGTAVGDSHAAGHAGTGLCLAVDGGLRESLDVSRAASAVD